MPNYSLISLCLCASVALSMQASAQQKSAPTAVSETTSKTVSKTASKKISQDFLEFAAEFSDDDEGMMDLLVKDADANSMEAINAGDFAVNDLETSAQSSDADGTPLRKRKHQLSNQASSKNTSTSEGETP